MNTADELKVALQYLRRGRSYSELDRLARNLTPEQGGPSRLSSSTLGDLFKKGTPSRQTLLTYLSVVGISPAEQGPWIAAWMRTRGDFHNVRVTAESDTIERAPDFTELIDAWLAHQEQDLTDPSSPGPSLGEQILREVETAASLIAETARRVNQLPEQPQGKADPVAFGRFVAEAVGLSMQRFMALRDTISGAPANTQTRTDFHTEVAQYLDECRRVLKLRAHILIAQWPASVLHLRLANPGDTDLSGLVVRLSFSDDVEIVKPGTESRTAPALPPRPAKADDRLSSPGLTHRDVFAEDLGLVDRLTKVFREDQEVIDYTIVDAETPTVEFSGMDLPGKESVVLPGVPLVIGSPVDAELSVRWTAAGSADHEQFTGTVGLRVSASTLSLENLFPAT